MMKAIFHGLWFLIKWFSIFIWYLTKFTFKYFIIPAAFVPIFVFFAIARLAGIVTASPFIIIEKLIPSIR